MQDTEVATHGTVATRTVIESPEFGARKIALFFRLKYEFDVGVALVARACADVAPRARRSKYRGNASMQFYFARAKHRS
jgi:hypothetical protein